MNTCGECEHFGDAYLRHWTWKFGSSGKFEKYLGSGPSETPATHCLIQDNLSTQCNCNACAKFIPRTWERPKTCGGCDRKARRFEDGSFNCQDTCQGARSHTESEPACLNGKRHTKLGQLDIFDAFSQAAEDGA